jgi:hypothetical protein
LATAKLKHTHQKYVQFKPVCSRLLTCTGANFFGNKARDEERVGKSDTIQPAKAPEMIEENEPIQV